MLEAAASALATAEGSTASSSGGEFCHREIGLRSPAPGDNGFCFDDARSGNDEERGTGAANGDLSDGDGVHSVGAV